MDNNKIALFLFPVILIAGALMWAEAMKVHEVPEPEFMIPHNNPDEPALNPAGYSLQCSRTYKPVCGQIQEGKKQTFPNACSARSKGATVLSDGACDEELIKTTDLTAERRYISQEEEICETKEFKCEEGETSFFDEQGCGCQSILLLETENKKENPDTILFEGCPEILYELLCPSGYTKFEEANECGCKR